MRIPWLCKHWPEGAVLACFLHLLILGRRERGEFSVHSCKLTDFSVRTTHAPEMVPETS